MMRASVLLPAVLAMTLVLAACGREAGTDASTASQTPSDAPTATDAPASEAPVPPATPTAATPEEAPAVPPVDESATPAGTEGPTGFHGFGPARFGDDEESVRIAWGRPLAFDRELEPGDTCAYLQIDPRPEDGSGIAFMIEEGKFVRYDVSTTDYEAPGGGRVGMERSALESLYHGRFELAPHKYIEGGHTLRVAGPDGSESALVFELDASGQASEWRIGLPPPVDYVEGCS